MFDERSHSGRPQARRVGRWPGLAGLVAAAIVVLVSFDGGGYSTVSRNTFAIAALWALLFVGTNVTAREQLPTPARVVALLFALFAAWTGLSAVWASNGEAAFTEFNREVLYLAVFLLVSLLAARRRAATLLDAAYCAIIVVLVAALVSRLYPGPLGIDPLRRYGSSVRLSYPLNYWNGLAIFGALAIPLALRLATNGRLALLRAGAAGGIPIVMWVTYLASSRSAALVAVVGALAMLVLAQARWANIVVLANGLVWGAVGLALIARENVLVNGPLSSEQAAAQGHHVGPLLLVLVLAAATTWAGAHPLRTRFRPSAYAGWAAVAAVVVVGAFVLARAHPVAHVRAFTKPPPVFSSGNYVGAHFLQSNGTGRWQVWSAALAESRDEPATGRGAGSFEGWWAKHGSLPDYVRNAHSLFLESLGELGLVGFGLIVAIFVVGAATGVRRARAHAALADAAAAASAVVMAFVAGAAVEWIWQVTAVGLIGVGALALCTGAATDVREHGGEVRRRSRGTVVGARVAIACTCAGLIACQAIPLAAQLQIRKSQAAAARRDWAGATKGALAATAIQPWAATPYLQLALVREQAGQLVLAQSASRRAIARDPSDWRLWLVRARLETKAGRVSSARRSLLTAVELNPRSPLFAGMLGRLRGR